MTARTLRRPLVVAGDPRAAAMCLAILDAAGLEPGFHLASGAREPSARRKIVGGSAKPPPFVVAADAFAPAEADKPELTVAIVGTNAPTIDAALLVADARSPHAAALAQSTERTTTFYGLDGDTFAVTPGWLAAAVPFDAASGAQPFDLYAGGSSCGRFALALREGGADAIRSAVAAIAACAEGFGVHVEKARHALALFREASGG